MTVCHAMHVDLNFCLLFCIQAYAAAREITASLHPTLTSGGSSDLTQVAQQFHTNCYNKYNKLSHGLLDA